MNWTEAHMMGDLEAMTDKIDVTPEMIDLLPSTQMRKLKQKNAALSARLTEVENTLGLADDQRKEWEAHCKAAEAQLAKAVRALKFIGCEDNAEGRHARAALAEIGEGHE